MMIVCEYIYIYIINQIQQLIYIKLNLIKAINIIKEYNLLNIELINFIYYFNYKLPILFILDT